MLLLYAIDDLSPSNVGVAAVLPPRNRNGYNQQTFNHFANLTRMGAPLELLR